MTDLLNKFSKAAKAVSSNQFQTWECVQKAYVDHLSDINTESLPEEIQIFFDSVKLRVVSVAAVGCIDDNEASYIANDIRYMANVISSGI
jgi:hypothetical protein